MFVKESPIRTLLFASLLGCTVGCGSETATDAGPSETTCERPRVCGEILAPDLTGRWRHHAFALEGDTLFAVGPSGLEVFGIAGAPVLEQVGNLRPETHAFTWSEIHLLGERAYIVAACRACGQPYPSQVIQVVDVRDPSLPVLESVVELPAGEVIGVGSTGRVFVLDSGISQGEPSEVHVVDVDASPSLVASWTTLDTGRVHSVEEVGDVLYLYSAQDEQATLIALEISGVPNVLSTLALGPSFRVGQGKLNAVGDRTLVVFKPSDGGMVVDVADPNNLRQVAELDTPPLFNALNRVSAAEHSVVFGRTMNGVVAVDVSDPAAPRVSQAESTSFTFAHRALSVSGSLVRVVGEEGIVQIDFADFMAPRELSSVDLGQSPQPRATKIAVDGARIYVADGSRGVRAFEVCASTVREVISPLMGLEVDDLVAENNVVAVSDRASSTVRLFDMAESNAFVPLGAVPLLPPLERAARSPFAPFALTEYGLAVASEDAVSFYRLADMPDASPYARVELPSSIGSWGVVAAGSSLVITDYTSEEVLRIDLPDANGATLRDRTTLPREFSFRGTFGEVLTLSHSSLPGTWLIDPSDGADLADQVAASPWLPEADAAPFGTQSRGIDSQLQIWDPVSETVVRQIPGAADAILGVTEDDRAVTTGELFRVVDLACEE